jgi:hypothetical protein
MISRWNLKTKVKISAEPSLKLYLKQKYELGASGSCLIIIITYEAKISRISAQSQLRQIVRKTLS